MATRNTKPKGTEAMNHEQMAGQLSGWTEKDWTEEEVKSLTWSLAMDPDLHAALNRRVRHERNILEAEMRATHCAE